MADSNMHRGNVGARHDAFGHNNVQLQDTTRLWFSLSTGTPYVPEPNRPELATEMTTEQDLQDSEYYFPYHYVAQFRDGFKHFFLDTWSINYASTIEYLLQEITSGSHGRIVDIGCGDGRFSRELSLACSGSSVVGIDYSSRAVTLASAMNQDIGNLQFSSLDITGRLDLEPFDAAVLMEVFEHIPLNEADRFMRGVRDLLRQGGELYLTVPHVNKPVEYKHFQHFSVATIGAYLQPYFNIVEITPFEKKSCSRRILSMLLSNWLFILNNTHLLKFAYRWYKKHLFFCESEKSCQRIYVKAVAK